MEKDKKIPVMITVAGIHKTIISKKNGYSSLCEADETKETATGFFSSRNGKIYLIYETESEENGSSYPIKIRTTIKISSSEIEVKRTITSDELKKYLTSAIIYKTGSRNAGTSETPYGILDTETYTKKITCSESDLGLTCIITGTIYINNSPSSEFDLKIEAVML